MLQHPEAPTGQCHENHELFRFFKAKKKKKKIGTQKQTTKKGIKMNEVDKIVSFRK